MTDPALLARKLALVDRILNHHLGDLDAFVTAVRRRLQVDESGPPVPPR